MKFYNGYLERQVYSLFWQKTITIIFMRLVYNSSIIYRDFHTLFALGYFIKTLYQQVLKGLSKIIDNS